MKRNLSHFQHEDNGVYGRQANPERESEVRGYGTRYRQSSYSSSYGYNRNSRESREYGRTETSGSRETYGRPDPSSGLCKPRINKFKAQPEADQNIADQCFASQAPQCNRRTKYRTLDGTCNNLRRPWWGAVDTAHVRLMRPYYEDGEYGIRIHLCDTPCIGLPTFDVRAPSGRLGFRQAFVQSFRETD
jgi:Animal haem peroxidase.